MTHERLTRRGLVAAAATTGGVLLASLPDAGDAAPSAALDRRILTFALLLEDVQAGFYADALSTARLQGELLDYARTVGAQETRHAQTPPPRARRRRARAPAAGLRRRHRRPRALRAQRAAPGGPRGQGLHHAGRAPHARRAGRGRADRDRRGPPRRVDPRPRRPRPGARRRRAHALGRHRPQDAGGQRLCPLSPTSTSGRSTATARSARRLDALGDRDGATRAGLLRVGGAGLVALLAGPSAVAAAATTAAADAPRPRHPQLRADARVPPGVVLLRGRAARRGARRARPPGAGRRRARARARPGVPGGARPPRGRQAALRLPRRDRGRRPLPEDRGGVRGPRGRRLLRAGAADPVAAPTSRPRWGSRASRRATRRGSAAWPASSRRPTRSTSRARAPRRSRSSTRRTSRCTRRAGGARASRDDARRSRPPPSLSSSAPSRGCGERRARRAAAARRRRAAAGGLPAPGAAACAVGAPRALAPRRGRDDLGRRAHRAPPRAPRRAQRRPRRRAARRARPRARRTSSSVLARRRDAGGALWVRVALPALPNGRTGWVPRAALGAYGTSDLRLVVDRARADRDAAARPQRRVPRAGRDRDRARRRRRPGGSSCATSCAATAARSTGRSPSGPAPAQRR